VASVNATCCGANVYGLNELRVFEAPSITAEIVPEPAPLALLGFGLAALGVLRKKRTA
jgi:hypothetical protein